MNRDRRVFLFGRNILQYIILLLLIGVSAHIFHLNALFIRILLVYEAVILMVFGISQLDATKKEKVFLKTAEDFELRKLCEQRDKCQKTISSVYTSVIICDFLFALSRKYGYFLENINIVQQMSFVVMMLYSCVAYLAWVLVKHVIHEAKYSTKEELEIREISCSRDFMDEFGVLIGKMKPVTALRLMYDKVPMAAKQSYKDYMEKMDAGKTAAEVKIDIFDIINMDNSTMYRKKNNKNNLDLMVGLFYMPQIMSVELIAVELLGFLTIYTGIPFIS